LDFDNLAEAEEKLTMKELVEYYDATTTGGKRKNTRKITTKNTRKNTKKITKKNTRKNNKFRKGKGFSLESPKTPKSSKLSKSLVPKLYNVIEQIIINTLKSLTLKEFININIIPIEEQLNVEIDTSISSKSLARKHANLKTSPKTYKQEKTSYKESESLEYLIKYNYSSSINLKNANIQNKYYINIVRQRHNKIHENNKKILDVLELNSGIKLKEKVITTPKRLNGTLKKKSLNKSFNPISIMAF
jgi:hypothetical protein